MDCQHTFASKVCPQSILVLPGSSVCGRGAWCVERLHHAELCGLVRIAAAVSCEPAAGLSFKALRCHPNV